MQRGSRGVAEAPDVHFSHLENHNCDIDDLIVIYKRQDVEPK